MFEPVVVLMNRLRLAEKLTLVGVVCVLIVAFLCGQLAAVWYQKIHAIKNSPQGVSHMRPLLHVDDGAERPFRPAEATGAGERFGERAVTQFDQALAGQLQAIYRQIYVVSGVTLLALLAAAYLFVGMYQAMRNAATRLSQDAARIAAGDLTPEVSTNARDEVGEAAASFHRVVQMLRGLIGNVQRGAEAINAAAAHLSRAAQRINDNSRMQSEVSASTAAAVEQMTVSITQVADNSKEASGIASESSKLSAEGEAIVQKASREIGQIAESVNATEKTIKALSARSGEINGIVRVIKEIADQTNLLALNAAIEAARAGEQGRGFAVVADEVRKLAERTGKATNEITAMIDAIQTETVGAARLMGQSSSQVASGVQHADRAAASLARINAGAGRTLQRVSEIATAVREQSTASNEIAKNVERIAQMTEETGRAVTDTSAAAKHLEALARELKVEAARFRLHAA